MPARLVRNRDGTYRVVTPNATHAKHTTKRRAQAQARLLNALEHGWRPTYKRR